MQTSRTLFCLAFLTSSALAQQAPESQSVSVGPWAIATTYKADKFNNCIMSRTFEDVDMSFVRTGDGLSLLLDSQKWKLERGKVYPIRLAAGPQTLDAKALAHPAVQRKVIESEQEVFQSISMKHRVPGSGHYHKDSDLESTSSW